MAHSPHIFFNLVTYDVIAWTSFLSEERLPLFGDPRIFSGQEEGDEDPNETEGQA